MKYLYYPGCSLKSTGRAYEESMLAVFGALDIPLPELHDWNCCGATAYMAISELKAFALCARNFSLAAEQAKGDPDVSLVVPCAACYLGLNKAYRYMHEHPDLKGTIDKALQSAGLGLADGVRVRHPLDVIVNDIGLDKISSKVTSSLAGMKVACYYGCQIIRPYADFDDQQNPTTMNRIMHALGAKTLDWPLKTRCCGGSLTGTIEDVGTRLSYILLREAKLRGADVIVTACPLCQFNLECYQTTIGRMYHDRVDIPVVYFTQLMGMAMGLDAKALGLQRLISPRPVIKEAVPVQGGQHVGA